MSEANSLIMDIWQYTLQKEREFERYSVTPDRELDQMFQAASDPPDGKRGLVRGNLIFPEQDAYLRVYERIVVQGPVPRRETYAYSLIINGVHEYGWAREPDHDPQVHEHVGEERTRRPADPIGLGAVLEIAWNWLSQLAEVRWDYDEPDAAA